MPDLPLWALLWFAVLVALGALFAMTYRRMSTLTTRTRDLEDFQEAVESIDRRFGGATQPLLRGPRRGATPCRRPVRPRGARDRGPGS